MQLLCLGVRPAAERLPAPAWVIRDTLVVEAAVPVHLCFAILDLFDVAKPQRCATTILECGVGVGAEEEASGALLDARVLLLRLPDLLLLLLLILRARGQQEGLRKRYPLSWWRWP